MKSYRPTWKQDGRDEQQVSAVTYGLSAAEDYKARKESEGGVSDVEIVPVKPGRKPPTRRCQWRLVAS
ncbi:hypothetical protein OG462_41510 [Streptomyces sp. NBC_01077]|uniref:hypothetical protein n=1 Tax=Streptomyces sp. NBC_01077 TaxID=2903746 RepID=UPI00386FD56D|nr:hypothetical protein OG462_41510 [Streptomyces sp. NBC_01077]